MLLNRLETALMNNRLRAFIQRRVEARKLLDLGGHVAGKHCLEVGCGRGVGTEIIFDCFGARTVDAFDLDPKMIALAHKRLKRYGHDVKLWQGSVTAIEAPDDHYDAVFDFAIIHHVPDWPHAIEEVVRVLKPGGRFFAEEPLARFIEHPVWRRLLDHPRENRFDGPGFVKGLRAAGLAMVDSYDVHANFGFYVAEKTKSAAA